MRGKFDYKGTSYRYEGSAPREKVPNSDDPVNGLNLRNRGINFEPTIGATSGEGLPILTPGIRTQWSQMKSIDAPGFMGIDEKWCNDYQYGVLIANSFRRQRSCLLSVKSF